MTMTTMRKRDLLFMSWDSLMKRKIRTVLTILGVVIGIASIVIMVSLALGMMQQSMEQIEQYGGLRTIEVTEGSGSGGADEGNAVKYKPDDSTVETIRAMEHVTMVSPVLNTEVVLRSGAYVYPYASVRGYTLEALKDMKFEFAAGGLPEKGDQLKLIYGNHIREEFQEAATGRGYWDTMKMPDIDFMKSTIFCIYDTDAYMDFTDGDGLSGGEEDGGDKVTAPPKKYVMETAGELIRKDEDDYSDSSFAIYCEIEAMKSQLKKVFRGKAIPGQPLKKNGKPYRQFYYNSVYVKVDSTDNVTVVEKQIRDMGFSTYSNSEWIEQTQAESRTRQTMLGSIGAVALLVASIGIANTMMMSIYERTKEIGVMKVLGCDMGDLFALFMLEAALIGFIGGVAGDLLSFIVSKVINTVTGETTTLIPLWLYLLGLGFAVLVGMAAGVYPSRRAMGLSPLTAIRNE